MMTQNMIKMPEIMPTKSLKSIKMIVEEDHAANDFDWDH